MSRQLPPDPIYVLRGSMSPVTCLHTPDTINGTLYSGNQDGQILLWNLKTKRITEIIDAHPKFSILWLKTTTNKHLITQGRDGYIKLWNNIDSHWQEKEKYRCSSQTFCCCTIFCNEEKQYIALPSDKTSTIDILDMETTQVISSLTPDDGKYGMCMCINYTGCNRDNKHMMLIAYENGTILLWNIFSQTVLDKIQMYQETIMCMDYSINYMKGICGSVGKTLITFKVIEDQLFKDQTLEVINEGFSSITIRPDNKLVVTTGWDGFIRLFSFKSWKHLAVLLSHKETVQSSSFSSDNILFCGSKDKLISMWKIY